MHIIFTGNLLVPNDNYCLFEDWVMPLLDEMLDEQRTMGALWTPSKVIARYIINICKLFMTYKTRNFI